MGDSEAMINFATDWSTIEWFQLLKSRQAKD
jgi:hypothetical protein